MNIQAKRGLTAGVLAFSLIASMVPGNDSNAASAKINKKKITVSRGTCYKLKVKGISGKITWKSSNKKVATVNKNGKVSAKKAGTAKITAKIRSQKFTCKVTVRKKIASTNKPVITPSPEATQKPTTTQQPITTQRPTTSQRPAATQRPTSWQWPVVSQRPVASQWPVISQKPATSQNPLPSETAAPSVSGTVTEETAYNILNSLRSTYPEGMTLTNSYYYYSPRFGNGYGCYGFAAKLSDTIFGTEKPYQTHSSFDQIKVGDNIRIGNSHSVIVLTKEVSHITVVEGNYNSSVHWDRKITSSSLASSGFKVYTRY